MSEKNDTPVKEKLIIAGIDEIAQHGVRDFSLRRTASACGVSCAAPYKHFRSKDELILAILSRYQERWHAIQDDIITRCDSGYREQLIEISLAYIRFLVSNPAYRAIMMLNEEGADDELARKRSVLSSRSQERIHLYCEEVHMPHDIEVAKTYIVRSFIYGAALMISNGELPDLPQIYDMIRRAIAREFEIDFDISLKL